MDWLVMCEKKYLFILLFKHFPPTLFALKIFQMNVIIYVSYIAHNKKEKKVYLWN